MTGGRAAPAEDGGFGTDNLPYGVFERPGEPPRVGVRVGDHVLDLAGVSGDPVFAADSLNPFMARGPAAWRAARAKVAGLLHSESGRAATGPHLVPLESAVLRPPFQVADYAVFRASAEHAADVERARRPEVQEPEPLPPGWPHRPLGRHGRAGSVLLSGSDVPRPVGQRRAPDGGAPLFGPSERLDVEAGLGFVVGCGTSLGRPAPISEFAEHVFGVVLLNDWTARDILDWEEEPLGPFQGMSFATSMSPWVVPLDALGAARRAGRAQRPAPPERLRRNADWGLDVTLELRVNGTAVSRPPCAELYWTGDQLLAHLTANGAALRTGDLYGSGAVSGARRDQRGSLLGRTGDGAEPVALADGTSRGYLADGDTVTVTGTARGMGGAAISLGEVTGTVRPPVPRRP
ncbi:fumarylacetoacetate hydrolase family protein [Marinitenerispora sediminis]|uniref:fumarylacetoacetase n=1 Tax=Marinitenerispora sediminis TaxID=1931232 RepID=A0A368T6A6_9ACTN|nr:fumarylacetoacetate hydrolase family protein [Marinitenerispora sediminis]RCV52206.1 fumarylacetoacetase [Marinitenerispora sediminis]RCV55611.1 fumarylacetoacetase [Marinitenerispora sediminis]RCV59206.1 fumarylacetoacetase [Marinitenerispora sediminis]